MSYLKHNIYVYEFSTELIHSFLESNKTFPDTLQSMIPSPVFAWAIGTWDLGRENVCSVCGSVLDDRESCLWLVVKYIFPHLSRNVLHSRHFSHNQLWGRWPKLFYFWGEIRNKIWKKKLISFFFLHLSVNKVKNETYTILAWFAFQKRFSQELFEMMTCDIL